MPNLLDNIKKLAESKNDRAKADRLAAILKTSPENMKRFQAAYEKQVLAQEPDGIFETNSRQAAAQAHYIDPEAPKVDVDLEELDKLIHRAVDELLADTKTYIYDGNTVDIANVKALPAGSYLTNKDLEHLPLAVRPQVTGELMKTDCPPDAGFALLADMLDASLHAKTPKARQNAYHQFRQGLDILDLDPIMYEMLGMNRNSMGNWFPQLVEACKTQTFFRLPKTVIAKVPMTLLQLSRTEYTELTDTTRQILDQWAYEAFRLRDDGDYFIKTGTYSSKFDFRNCRVHDKKEIRELGEYLMYIQFQATMMAGPLTTPCMYDVSTTNEWVVREFIPDKENNPTIYKGLPLHTEYRVFVDCDSAEVLGMTPYWEPETMKNRFAEGIEKQDPNHLHDYAVYKAHEDTLMARYEANKDAVRDAIANLLPALKLTGQWSIDVMQNGDEFWIIDMAVAENSAFYNNCVPPALRHPVEENWIPQLEAPET